jgi:tetratricopeptide (TPR) repeat protein
VTPLVVAALALLPVVRFPNSGAPVAQPAFLRGVTALHNFQYEDAVEAFREAQGIDRDFAMAYWGEAMACNQTLWLNQDVEEARKILARLAPTTEARARKAGTGLEKGYLKAVEVLFGDGDRPARDRAYAEAMGRLAELYPNDVEVLCFQALALMGTAARSPALFREGGDDLHQHALVGSETQRRAAAILERVLAAQPDHPGALHYLIHDYDDPEHARKALPAARAYAKVAPQSSHALHMPAHIFLQLGMWDEAAASDEASFAASVASVARKGLPIGMRDHHSLSWVLYESLQRGRFARARETLELIRPAVDATSAPRLKALQSDMRARYVVEARDFEMLAGARGFDTSSELFAIGMSAARRGDGATAELARAELGRRAARPAGEKDVAIMERELAGLVSLAGGQRADALARLEEAATLERALPPPLGPARPVKPASELLGEVLLELGRPRDAVPLFTRTLERYPNRSLSLLGLGRAWAAVGDDAGVHSSYQKFLANWAKGDAGRPEADEARKALAKR